MKRKKKEWKRGSSRIVGPIIQTFPESCRIYGHYKSLCWQFSLKTGQSTAARVSSDPCLFPVQTKGKISLTHEWLRAAAKQIYFSFSLRQ